jgi:hypothetical protein
MGELLGWSRHVLRGITAAAQEYGEADGPVVDAHDSPTNETSSVLWSIGGACCRA